MCGIAGIIDLSGRRPVPSLAVRAMGRALFHRGPDEEGYLDRPELSFVSRRLSIVGLADGQQPIFNEDGSVAVVFNGELFDYPEARAALEARGHRFATHTDTELLPHLWEEYQEQFFDHVRGQFAFALWDSRRRRVVLARDRFGICPLYWTRCTRDGHDWLLFASEIKGLLASGLVEARPDPRGINHLFTFFALPGPVTCFAGVETLLPGQALFLQLEPDRTAEPQVRTYWEIDFPDRGEEIRGNEPQLAEEFESQLLRAVEKRLRADVPVVSYLSGGIDSSIVVAMASQLRGEPIPAFTVSIDDPTLNEAEPARVVAEHVGCPQHVAVFGRREVLNVYPRLTWAAEGPVIDTSAAALLTLAQSVHEQHYKVALTGEGADEWLAGYPYYKMHRVGSFFDFIPGLRLSLMLRRLYLRVIGAPRFPWSTAVTLENYLGGPNPWMDLYGLMSLSKLRFYSQDFWKELGDHQPWEDLQLNRDRMRRWHPLHRGLYLSARIQLPGLLLNGKGDRVAMHSAVETRYPFLDEDVFAFLAKLHPRWKLRGFREKYLLRRVADRWLPKSIAWRTKFMFRAPFDSFDLDDAPPYINQLLSAESLRKTGYFDPKAVLHWRQAYRSMRPNRIPRILVEMGLGGILATQLWHQIYIDASLAEVPDPRSRLRPDAGVDANGVAAVPGFGVRNEASGVIS